MQFVAVAVFSVDILVFNSAGQLNRPLFMISQSKDPLILKLCAGCEVWPQVPILHHISGHPGPVAIPLGPEMQSYCKSLNSNAGHFGYLSTCKLFRLPLYNELQSGENVAPLVKVTPVFMGAKRKMY